MQALLKEPVKEAVREALREAQAEDQARGSNRSTEGTAEGSDRTPAGGGRRFSSRLWLFVLVSVAGAIYYARRRSGRESTDEVLGGGDHTGFGESDDTSTDDPLSGGEMSGDESTSEGINR